MCVNGFEVRAEERYFAPHVGDHEEKSTKDGDHHGSLAEGESLEVRGAWDWQHGRGEVRGELAGPGKKFDEGLSGLTLCGGSHHSTRVE